MAFLSTPDLCICEAKHKNWCLSSSWLVDSFSHLNIENTLNSFQCPVPETTNLSIIAHDEVSEFHDFIVNGGPVPLLDDIVGCPPFTLLHHSSRPHQPSSSSQHLALLQTSCAICAVGGAWLQLLDWQLVSSSHYNRDGGQNVAAHQCLGTDIRSSTKVLLVFLF